MPYSLSLTLHPTRTLPTSAGVAHRAGNALLYRWLEAADPSLARFVHEQADPKPFTLSPLTPDGDERYRLRVTLLEDQYWAYVEKGMKQERTIRVEDRILALEGEPEVTHQTYIALAQSVATRRDIILRFDSPTCFKSHEMNYPLPDPVLVFASHCARWNAFAPEALRIGEAWSEWVAMHVAVSRLELSSQVFRFGDHQQIGSVGRVQYVVVGTGPEVEAGRGPLNALADYAFFCGTGHKTTQGMGQTRRLAPTWSSPGNFPS
jgi:CRISPR-associated endoribonuclease Cas6